MYIDPNLIIDSLTEAYDTFANLGFEKMIIIEDYNLDDGSKRDLTAYGLQLTKDTVRLGNQYQFLTEAHPTVFIREDKLPDDPVNPSVKLRPDHSQRIYQANSSNKKYSVNSINEIFNFSVVRLKP